MENDKPTEKTEEKKPEVTLRDLTPEKDAKGGGGKGGVSTSGNIKPSGSGGSTSGAGGVSTDTSAAS